MAEPFTLKQGDTSPPFSGQCVDQLGQPIATLGATVQFRMRPRVAGLRAPIVAAAVWDDPLTALATYQWVAGDTDVPGLYDAEFNVIYANGTSETFPNGEYVPVEILPPA